MDEENKSEKQPVEEASIVDTLKKQADDYLKG